MKVWYRLKRRILEWLIWHVSKDRFLIYDIDWWEREQKTRLFFAPGGETQFGYQTHKGGFTYVGRGILRNWFIWTTRQIPGTYHRPRARKG